MLAAHVYALLAAGGVGMALVVARGRRDRIVRGIADTEPLLGSYVHRYFEDMVLHARGLFEVVQPGGKVQYVVGNSKFYDVMLPAQEIFAAIFEDAGFTNAVVTTVRKRTSKRELYEYLVEARRPSRR